MRGNGARKSRRALRVVALGVGGVAGAYATAFGPPTVARVGPWCMAVAMPVLMLALLVLGASRADRSLRALVVPVGVVCVLVVGSLLLALALPPDTADAPLWLGFPRRAALVLYGVGVVPLFMLPVAYTRMFDVLTLTADDLARVRAARRST